jgi:hypothetical protein
MFATTFYWTLVYYPGAYFSSALDHTSTFMDHTIPISTLFVNLFFSNVKFTESGWQKIPYIGALYAIVNYAATMIMGTPVYSVETWTTVMSYVLAVLLVGALVLFYFIAAYFLNTAKQYKNNNNNLLLVLFKQE